MEKVKVIEQDRYRDGGTVVYIDAVNRLYYMWVPTKKIYNQIGGRNLADPSPYIREILVELEIVQSF